VDKSPTFAERRAASIAKTKTAQPAQGQESLDRYMGEDKYLIRPPKNKRSEPYMDDPDVPGEIIINWDYHDGDGVTLRQFKADSEASLVERNGEEWMGQNRRRLDKEFKDIIVRGLLT